VELFVENYADYIEDVVFNLKVRGVTPIIAHIERYRYINGRYEIVYRLIKEGALIQVNSYSVLGKRSSLIQRKIVNLFKHNLIHFIASDSHSPKRNPPDIFSAINLLKRKNIIDDAYIDYLISNTKKVINGEEIAPITPKVFRRRRFFI
jgi:protein-tyrosine phosphatase